EIRGASSMILSWQTDGFKCANREIVLRGPLQIAAADSIVLRPLRTGPAHFRPGIARNSADYARRVADDYLAGATAGARPTCELTKNTEDPVRASPPAIPSEVPNQLSKARITPRTVRTRPDPRLSRSELHRRNHAPARPSNCGRSARGTSAAVVI